MKSRTLIIITIIFITAFGVSSKGLQSKTIPKNGEFADSLYITGPESSCRPFVGVHNSQNDCLTLSAVGGDPNHEYVWKVISGDVQALIGQNNSSVCKILCYYRRS